MLSVKKLYWSSLISVKKKKKKSRQCILQLVSQEDTMQRSCVILHMNKTHWRPIHRVNICLNHPQLSK